MPASLSRRAFVVSLAAAVLAWRRTDACGHGRDPGPHPSPRPGITAAKVATAEQLAGEPADVRAAFEDVRRIPQVADGIRCRCECVRREGYRSLLTCYEGEHAMARHCMICQGEGRMAARLHRAGRTLDEIRREIDERYG